MSTQAATIITAPTPYHRGWKWAVFLAGAIDMGNAIDWQAWVIEQLRMDGHLTLVNPRRAQFTPDTLDEQIHWELAALAKVDTIFMWFPKDAKAPISVFEAGLYWTSGKLIVGAENGFYRRRNLEISAAVYDVVLYDNLQEMIDRLRKVAGRRERR